MISHMKEPREVGYAKEHEEFYRGGDPDISLTHKDSKSIFAGLNQKDLFIFAMAVGKYYNRRKKPSEVLKNVSVGAMSDQQKWALLAIGISESQDILQLENERPFYSLAEEYACGGIEIILDNIKQDNSSNYVGKLEKELSNLLLK